MTWRVHVYVPAPTATYDGRGARDFCKNFDDEPSAHRFALAVVEAGPASFASVDKVDPHAPVRARGAGAERDGPEVWKGAGGWQG